MDQKKSQRQDSQEFFPYNSPWLHNDVIDIIVSYDGRNINYISVSNQFPHEEIWYDFISVDHYERGRFICLMLDNLYDHEMGFNEEDFAYHYYYDKIAKYIEEARYIVESPGDTCKLENFFLYIKHGVEFNYIQPDQTDAIAAGKKYFQTNKTFI